MGVFFLLALHGGGDIICLGIAFHRYTDTREFWRASNLFSILLKVRVNLAYVFLNKFH